MHLLDFIKEKFVTMHSHMNVKFLHLMTEILKTQNTVVFDD